MLTLLDHQMLIMKEKEKKRRRKWQKTISGIDLKRARQRRCRETHQGGRRPGWYLIKMRK
jgi:hypothetical protein